MESFRDKVLSLDQLPAWRAKMRQEGKTVIATNGCFDLLHLGHITYLEQAAAHGDVLVVGVNSDASVRELKGPGRPIHSEYERAAVLAALASVARVSVFQGRTAADFLRTLQPDAYVKGGDITIATLPVDEREVLEKTGAKIIFAALVPQTSTTNIVTKIRSGTA